MIGSHSGKENRPIGRPVVKGTDIDKVKRNLNVVPLKPRNQLKNSDVLTNSLVTSFTKGINSPVTELANTFTELAANETIDTPKRRLSMASSSGSPTPNRIKISSQSSSPDSDTDSCDKPMTVAVPSKTVLESRFELQPLNKSIRCRAGNISTFRRFNSMPAAYLHNETSPLLNNMAIKTSFMSPLAQSPSKISFYIPGEDSGDSGFDKNEEFNFIPPSMPPEKAQAANEQSPVRVMGATGSPVLGSPDIHDCKAQHSIDSPLLADQLCSHEDQDDGFIDLDDLERQTCRNEDVPDAIANMLTGKMVAPSGFKNRLFKSPSVPSKLNSAGPRAFDIRKRVLCSKRPDPPRDSNTPVAANKKRRAVLSDGNMPPIPLKQDIPEPLNQARLLRCKSMVEHSASYELNKGDSNQALVGDFSKQCCLPLTTGKHGDLKSITAETMAKLIKQEYSDNVYEYSIIDCRYPYEYEGGHIKGAVNIYTKEDIYSSYLSEASLKSDRHDDKRSLLIFHCEFSSERAPRLSRFLRNHDRQINHDHYPSLFYPEIYLLEGGYKAFYENYKELCVPNSYKPMLHKDHSDDLKTFRAKSKSWAGPEKRCFRPGLTRRL